MKTLTEQIIDELVEKTEIGQNLEITQQYSFLIKPSSEITNKIMEFIGKLKQLDDRHFYYSVENLHLTIYRNMPISCDIPKLKYFLEQELKNIKLSFKVVGVSYTAVICEPIGFSLAKLRDKISQIVGKDSYDAASLARKERTWINFIRYKSEANHDLQSFLIKNRNLEFGSFDASELDLCKIQSKVLNIDQDKEFSI